MLSNELLKSRIGDFQDLGKEILSNKSELSEELVNGGMTNDGAKFDITLFQKQLTSIELERDRLINRNFSEGISAAAIPYDLPNYLMTMYTIPSFLTSQESVYVRFASNMQTISEIWENACENLNIGYYNFEHKLSGKKFGEKCINNQKIKSFIIAGAQQIVDYYSKENIYKSFDSTAIFGPTRPKALFLESMDYNQIPKLIGTSMFLGGQVCGLIKEIIPVRENYDQVKDLVTQTMEKIPFGSPDDLVGPIKDDAVFKKDTTLIEYFKKNKGYNIIVGGDYNIENKVIEPTLVECENGVPPDIDYFGPILLLNKNAKNKTEVIIEVQKDNTHGGYVFIFTQDIFEGFELEGIMKKEATTVKINTDITSESIDWPYGGYKNTFKFIKKYHNGYHCHSGKIYLSRELTSRPNTILKSKNEI